MPRKVNMHRFNGFGLGVYGGRTLENGDVEMAHGQIYSIKMENNRDTVAEGILKVEGKVIGSFLLYPHHKIEIERPVDLNKKFTFYKLNRLDGSRYSPYSSRHNGLIEAIFTPTLPSTSRSTRFTNELQSTYHNDTDGITAFTHPSYQQFSRYHKYIFDTVDKTILDLKLVAKPDMDYYKCHRTNYYEHPIYAHPYIWYDNPTPLYEDIFDEFDEYDEPYRKPCPCKDKYERCRHCCKCIC